MEAKRAKRDESNDNRDDEESPKPGPSGLQNKAKWNHRTINGIIKSKGVDENHRQYCYACTARLRPVQNAETRGPAGDEDIKTEKPQAGNSNEYSESEA